MLLTAHEGTPLERVHANIDELPAEIDTASPFERILSTYEPILQTLLAFLPTTSIFNLYHTSRLLRDFLKDYPLAWRSLSFRLPQLNNSLTSPGVTSPDLEEWQTKQYALDLAVKRVFVPLATRLTSLDLCNTPIEGSMLVGSVLELRKETLQHVSVRGCKHVSLKYHIVPFLHQCKIEMRAWGDKRAFALKSLYTYRCRHHRRRPYLPSSLARRDSDSEPTHDLIELCHQLGIWTDTAWCPTPGPRCHRRKDYHGNRAAPGTMEVWVPFDRLWRSGNRIGPAEEHTQRRPLVGKLWEEGECGYDGEPLGTKDSAIFAGEGKDVPTHQRKSHLTFVDNIKCDQCGDRILERCETCSIRMHCMGCRKTLCASCAFNRPLKKKKRGSIAQSDVSSSHDPQSSKSRKKEKKDKFWWAPGSTRSPNIMTDISEDPDSDDDTNHRIIPPRPQQHPGPLKVKMHWCCLEPLFSGGGGVAFVGPGLGGHGSERIRAVPLQQTREYMDPDFAPIEALMDENFQRFDNQVNSNMDILPYLQQQTLELQAKTCPRCLCNSCYSSFRWKVECKACKRAICKEHDFRALKVRKCGYRDLTEEREYVRNPPKHARDDLARESEWPRDLHIPDFQPPVESPGEAASTTDTASEDERRTRQSDDVNESQEWSDAGSTAEGPGTRDPSTTPRATPSPAADRSSSVASRAAEVVGLAQAIQNMDLVERAEFIATARPPVRGRSFSLSELTVVGKGKGRLIVQPPQPKERLLLPGNGSHPVQWKGCGAYYCQGSRSVGDTRPRCFATGKECSECGVYVCQLCLPNQTLCDCSFCESNYHCPTCTLKPDIQAQCTHEAERRAEAERLVREQEEALQRAQQEREDRKQADEILNWGFEFWGTLAVNGYVEADGSAGHVGVLSEEDRVAAVAAVTAIVAREDETTVPSDTQDDGTLGEDGETTPRASITVDEVDIGAETEVDEPEADEETQVVPPPAAAA
ncbi:hypothetical protein BT63DRAFT_371839 [Microthyrium microscopicum]|uniref:F-box domain-containing protein n=1 Tax=Microthyrium microscopicum TaxID=703497 RepID=A0A6A6UIF3_9PEZI|nr:hypothetical protein BT63DRAFT_371839 [Microthyrium microscopicum]